MRAGSLDGAVLLLALALPVVAARGAEGPAASACIACHETLDGELGDPAKLFAHDVHAEAGLGCESCHGGIASPENRGDAEASMDPKKGFKGAPDRLAVAAFCGGCHSDAEYMKRFDPKARVDQLAEYRTSEHGKRSSRGDRAVATCTDCHGAHGIRPISSPDSPVYAVNVPKTCARCHADKARMAPYGIPTNQYEEYGRSMHASALLERGDVAAPACNDCHGNHGAVPPGVDAIAQVCGQCHGRESILFRASFKKELFDGMDAGECTACHGNHRIDHPTPELFDSASEPEVSAGEIVGRDPLDARAGDLEAGRSVRVRFRSVLRPHIPTGDRRFAHRIEIAAEGVPPLVLDATVRPGETLPAERRGESAALLATLTILPLAGSPVEAGDAVEFRLEVRAGGVPARAVTVRSRPAEGVQSIPGSACATCHQKGDSCDQATGRMYASLQGLERDLRAASALLRKAEVAGMSVGQPIFELKSKGTTASVEARALIHSFEPERLTARTEEGQRIAQAATTAAREALDELQFRRKGLAVSLVLVGFVLVGLYFKIRQVSA